MVRPNSSFQRKVEVRLLYGATTALDIATSNLALLFVTVSFIPSRKPTLAWTLIWATLFKLEPCRLRTFFIVLLIVGGLIWRRRENATRRTGFRSLALF